MGIAPGQFFETTVERDLRDEPERVLGSRHRVPDTCSTPSSSIRMPPWSGSIRLTSVLLPVILYRLRVSRSSGPGTARAKSSNGSSLLDIEASAVSTMCEATCRRVGPVLQRSPSSEAVPTASSQSSGWSTTPRLTSVRVAARDEPTARAPSDASGNAAGPDECFLASRRR